MGVPPGCIRLRALLGEEDLRLQLQPPAEGPCDEAADGEPDAGVEGASHVRGLVEVASVTPPLTPYSSPWALAAVAEPAAIVTEDRPPPPASRHLVVYSTCPLAADSSEP